MPEEFVNELTPIAKYMASEMTRNPKSAVAQRILALNTSTEDCVKEVYSAAAWTWQATPDPTYCLAKGSVNRLRAMNLWYQQVRYDGPWDHKPVIKSRSEFRSRTGGERVPHLRRHGLQLRCLVQRPLRICRFGRRF